MLQHYGDRVGGADAVLRRLEQALAYDTVRHFLPALVFLRSHAEKPIDAYRMALYSAVSDVYAGAIACPAAAAAAPDPHGGVLRADLCGGQCSCALPGGCGSTSFL